MNWFDGSAVAILATFGAVIFTLLAIDIKSHAGGGAITLANAGLWSSVWVGASALFAGLLCVVRGADSATLFLAGYTLEKVLSVDNLIVFGAIFAYFGIPAGQQHKALHYGVIGAVIFRLIFVAVGIGSLGLFGPWVEGLLALLVAYSGWQMFAGMGGGDDDEIDHESRWYIRWTRKIYPGATRFVLCIVAIEVCDVLFAFDSVPAVLAVTQDAVIVYSAMIFAIMGLRSMYFVLEALRRFLAHLDKAVLLVLLFIAAKLALHATGLYGVSPGASLAVVVSILSTGVIASLLWPEHEAETEHGKDIGGTAAGAPTAAA